MGCASSSHEDRPEERISREIDERIKQDAEISLKQFRVLLRGVDESDISTIVKQMKISIGGYSVKERENFKKFVYADTVQSMVDIVKAMQFLNIEYGTLSCAEIGKKLADTFVQTQEFDLSGDIGDSLKVLWTDPGIQKCFNRSNEYKLNNFAYYFLNDLDRLCASDYIPTDDDVFRARVKAIGINETKFENEGFHLTLIECEHSRSYYTKFINQFFDNVHVILFCVDMSAYDYDEIMEKNRMRENLQLFERTCNNPFFSRTAIVLFFNNKDLFEEKLIRCPLTNCFEEYTGANEYHEALAYVQEQFERQIKNPETQSVYTQYACATDPDNGRFLWEILCHVIIKSIFDNLFKKKKK